MKQIVALLFILTSFSVQSQVSISSEHYGRLKNIKKEEFARFKKTKTIFILSNVFTVEEYTKVISDSWTITPFEIVNIKDVDLSNYDLEKTSFALLGAQIVNIQKSSGMNYNKYFTYFDFFIYERDKKKKEIEKYKNMSDNKKEKYNILNYYKDNFARFYLLPNSDLLLSLYNGDASFDIFSKESFYNYKLGFLKNYFQFINNKMDKNESYWFYQNTTTSEFKELKSKTLYIPSYISEHLSGDDKMYTKSIFEELFADYEYKYEFIEDNILNQKILAGEEFYYLRYARVNTERFLQVVNSKNGEIIYADYITGLSVSLKPKHIKELSKAVSKS
jgi:hypothetical protein